MESAAPRALVTGWYVLVFCGGCARSGSFPGNPSVIEYSLNPTQSLAPSEELLWLSQTAYEMECAAGHRPADDGFGAPAYLHYPRPRDFTRGQFRLISTWDNVPTDEDLSPTHTTSSARSLAGLDHSTIAPSRLRSSRYRQALISLGPCTYTRRESVCRRRLADEPRQIALAALPTLGLPRALDALRWVDESIEEMADS